MDNLATKYCRVCQKVTSYINNECGGCRDKKIVAMNNVLTTLTIEQRVKRLEDIIVKNNLRLDP